MEFTLNKNDLVRELNLSQGVVERKTTIPILSNVLIEAAGEHLTLTATDLELGIRCSAPANVKSPGSGTIPAKKLLDYVRLLPDGQELVVKFSDNQWASLTCGRSRTRIAGMSRESFPELPEMPATMAQMPIGLLAGMIAKSIFAISAEESRFTLNGSLLLLKGDKITMVSTDGHRLAMVECDNPLASAEVSYRALLPKKAMGEILKLAGDTADRDAAVEFSGDDNHLFFRLGGRLLISRKLTGNFPDFERVLPKSHAHLIEIDKEEFRASIERVAQFSDERSRAIKVKFADNEVTVHSSLSESGESEESLVAEYDGPTVEIGFNAQYLLEFLRAVPESKVAIHFKDAQSAGELRPSGEGVNYNYRYVVMPMRI